MVLPCRDQPAASMPALVFSMTTRQTVQWWAATIPRVNLVASANSWQSEANTQIRSNTIGWGQSGYHSIRRHCGAVLPQVSPIQVWRWGQVCTCSFARFGSPRALLLSSLDRGNVLGSLVHQHQQPNEQWLDMPTERTMAVHASGSETSTEQLDREKLRQSFAHNHR